MSTPNRKQSKAHYHHTYKRIPTGTESCCYYCGEPSTELDHVPPLSAAHLAKVRYLVPSCHECNALLSDRAILKLEQRASYLSEKYKKRYCKVLRAPHWSREEIDGLKGRLKEMIIEDLESQKIINERIRCLESVARS